LRAHLGVHNKDWDIKGQCTNRIEYKKRVLDDLTNNDNFYFAGDSLAAGHNGERFATKDRDYRGCSNRYKGAWWYRACHISNLNGLYLPGQTTPTSVAWRPWKGNYVSLKKVEMKMRPVV